LKIRILFFLSPRRGLALRLPCFARQIFLLIFSSRKVGRLLKRLATCPPRRVISNAQRRSKNEEVGKTSLPIRRGGQVSRVGRPACRKQDTKDLMRFGKDEKKSQPLKVRIPKTAFFCSR